MAFLFVLVKGDIVQGTIKTLKKEQGYGFIKSGKESYFFHVSQCDKGIFDQLEIKDPVEFDTMDTKKEYKQLMLKTKE